VKIVVDDDVFLQNHSQKSHNINLPSIFTQLNTNLPSTQRSYAGLRAFSSKKE